LIYIISYYKIIIEKNKIDIMKNHTLLEFRIAARILNINKYILLILLEKRENPVNIGHIFDRKVFLTSLFSKAESRAYAYKDKISETGGAELLSRLKDILTDITESDKTIINILTERKENAADKISMLRKLSSAVKAYGAN
jgi:hypothetical protein